MDTVKLDAKDRKIMSELDMDARQSLSNIARRVGLSKDSVNYRIKQMEKKKIIEGYYAAIDTTKLGYLFIRLFVRLQRMNLQKEKEIMEYAQTSPYIGWIVAVDGSWDFVFGIKAKTIYEFEKGYDDFISHFGEYIQEKYVSIATQIYHFKHNFLYDKYDEMTEVILGEKEVDMKLDEVDHKILEIVAQNGRMSTLDIANRLEMTANAIKYRIKKLVKNKVIIAFRAKINTSLLGYEHYKVFLTLQNISDPTQNKMKQYLRQNPNVVYITKGFGIADLEFEVMFQRQEELHEFMKAFRFEFSDVLKDYDTILLYRQPVINYLPE